MESDELRTSKQVSRPPCEEYSFPAIRGVQAGREYYVSMCPLKLIPRLFLFDEEELTPELRAQRTLNQARVPEIARYMTENGEDYVFSAITASIDAEVEFTPLDDSTLQRLGSLHIPLAARFVINDGQHRRAAIELAIRERPDLGDETIAVVFFLDIGLSRCQQMFADLNRYAVRASPSLGVLYDHRDPTAALARHVVFQCEAFQGLVEMERTSLSTRSQKLFTLSSIAAATSAFISRWGYEAPEVRAEKAVNFWNVVARQMPDWAAVRQSDCTSGDIRSQMIHTSSLVLEAIARAGLELITTDPDDMPQRWAALREIDWRRSNPNWEGRAMTAGAITKSHKRVILVSNVIKKAFRLPLNAEERRIENLYLEVKEL